MSISNRAAKLTKTHRVLKKHYTPVTPPARPLLEHLLFACCLENASHEAAEEAFARLQEAYYDWNEVRVTTITELVDTLSCLPDPAAAATRLKRTLQSVFETYYSFDLDGLAKENIGQAVKKIQRLDGVTAYAVAFVTQNGLGGHAIPVNAGVLEALEIVGVISAAEAQEGRVPGMERAIPKSKGIEFASLLHQLGVDYASARFSPRVRKILLEIDPEAKDRFPKRTRKPDEAEETPPAASAKTRRAKSANQSGSGGQQSTKPSAGGKKSTGSKKGSRKRGAEAKTPSKSPKKAATNRLSKKKPR